MKYDVCKQAGSVDLNKARAAQNVPEIYVFASLLFYFELYWYKCLNCRWAAQITGIQTDLRKAEKKMFLVWQNIFRLLRSVLEDVYKKSVHSLGTAVVAVEYYLSYNNVMEIHVHDYFDNAKKNLIGLNGGQSNLEARIATSQGKSILCMTIMKHMQEV